LKSLFAGAAGVLWALDELRRLGHAETRLDLGELALRNLELFRARPDFMKIELPEPRMSSLLCGETGILLVTWRLAPGAELADALLERVRGNVSNEAEEVMWGTPGTLIAARAMRARVSATGQPETDTPSSRRSSAPVTSVGSNRRAASPFTRSVRCDSSARGTRPWPLLALDRRPRRRRLCGRLSRRPQRISVLRPALAWRKELDLGVVAAGPGEARIARDERCPQKLCDVDGDDAERRGGESRA